MDDELNRVVHVYAKLENDGGYKCSSGYLLGENLLLTVKHGLVTVATGDSSLQDPPEYSIGPNASNVRYVTFTADDILFPSSEEMKNDFDSIVVIQYVDPENILPIVTPALLAMNPPNPFSSWSAKGFPDAFSKELNDSSQTELACAHGEISVPSTDCGIIHLTNKVVLENIDDWRGMSGAAILCDGQVIGVLSDVRKASTNAMLGLSIPFLLNSNFSGDENRKQGDDFREICILLNQSLKSDEAIREEYNEFLSNVIEPEIQEIFDESEESRYLLIQLKNKYRVRRIDDADFIHQMVFKYAGKRTIALINNIINGLLEAGDWDRAESCYSLAESLIGWLLLKSVNQRWLVENQLIASDPLVGETFHNQINLADKQFVEVVISRFSERPSEYELDEKTDNIRGRCQRSVSGRSFSSGKKSSTQQDLMGVYEDIRMNSGNNKVSVILEFIIRHLDQFNFESNEWKKLNIKSDLFAEVEIEYLENEDKVVYYIVSEREYKIFTNEICREIFKPLQGMLKFVLCEEVKLDSEKNDPVSSEGSKTLIGLVRNFLKLERQIKQGEPENEAR